MCGIALQFVVSLLPGRDKLLGALVRGTSKTLITTTGSDTAVALRLSSAFGRWLADTKYRARPKPGLAPAAGASLLLASVRTSALGPGSVVRLIEPVRGASANRLRASCKPPGGRSGADVTAPELAAKRPPDRRDRRRRNPAASVRSRREPASPALPPARASHFSAVFPATRGEQGSRRARLLARGAVIALVAIRREEAVRCSETRVCLNAVPTRTRERAAGLPRLLGRRRTAAALRRGRRRPVCALERARLANLVENRANHRAPLGSGCHAASRNGRFDRYDPLSWSCLDGGARSGS